MINQENHKNQMNHSLNNITNQHNHKNYKNHRSDNMMK